MTHVEEINRTSTQANAEKTVPSLIQNIPPTRKQFTKYILVRKLSGIKFAMGRAKIVAYMQIADLAIRVTAIVVFS